MNIKNVLLFLFLLTTPVSAQTLANVTVSNGQPAVFSASIPSGSCRSLWSINGVGHWGNVGSSWSWTIQPTDPAYKTGTTVMLDTYSCTNGLPEARQTVTLTVLASNFTITVNTNLSTIFTVAQVNGNVSTGICQINGSGTCSIYLDRSQTYSAVVTLAGVPLVQQTILGNMIDSSVSKATIALQVNANSQVLPGSGLTLQ